MIRKLTFLNKNKFKQVLKSALSIIVCFCMIVSFTFYKPVKAHATVTACIIGGAIAVSVAAAALGIGCSKVLPTPAYNQACQDIWDHIDYNVKKNVNAMQTAGTLVTGFLSSAFLHAVVDGFQQHYPSQVYTSQSWSSLENILGFTHSDVSYGWRKLDLSQYQFTPLSYYTNVTWSTHGYYTFGATSIGTWNILIGNGTQFYSASDSLAQSMIVSNHWNTAGADQGLVTKIALLQAVRNSVTQYFLIDNMGGGVVVNLPSDQTVDNPKPDVYNPANENFFAQGLSVMNHKVDDVISRVAQAEGVLGGIQVYLPPIVGTLSDINDQIKSLTQSQVTQKDVTTTDDKTKNEDTNKGRNTEAPKNPDMPDLTLPTGIQKKFPFCLPWDLMALYKLFQVSPKAPNWDVPINIDQGMIHVHQTYKFDMNSNGVMDNFLPVFKWFLNLAVVAGLIFLFKKIVS